MLGCWDLAIPYLALAWGLLTYHNCHVRCSGGNCDSLETLLCFAYLPLGVGVGVAMTLIPIVRTFVRHLAADRLVGLLPLLLFSCWFVSLALSAAQ
jgi:hypothetical protein